LNISIVILLAVFILIAVRQVGNVRLQIWQIMLLGAVAVLATQQISIHDALISINLDVMVFLFGMFVVGQAFEESGYLSHVSYKYFSKAKSVDAMILLILFGFGFASALLMNDTLAIIGTPVVLLLAKKHQTSAKLLLLTLCISVTTGSVLSPIGNPQNLLIAVNGIRNNAFVDFFRWLFIPTVINMYIAFRFLKLYYPGDFHNVELSHSQEPIRNHNLAMLAKISLSIILILVMLKILLFAVGSTIDFRLTYIALVAALPILLASPRRFHILRRVDWHTLIFFAAMFVLMESVWLSGFVQRLLTQWHFTIVSLPAILTVSVLLSQLISNVPLVALYQPMLLHAGASVKELVALAAGSTIAGNLLILGAASNVIVIQNAEKKGNVTITFWEFARIGIPLTLIQTAVYWLAFELL
jgi:Na+/H+ antiporter NhaD/arsenite permease-like protein